jgi:hypothetical protein
MLAVMLVNIGKHHLPYIEYNLFRNYIVANLCIQRTQADNCCQGKCYLEKQINRVNEADESTAASQMETKQVKCEIFDYIKTNIYSLIQILFVKAEQSQFVNLYLVRIFIDIPVPPPQRFI